MKNQKQIGVWLDMRNAMIIAPEESEIIHKINSDISEFNPKGGYGSSVPYEAQEAVSEKHYLNRKNQQMQKYFDEIFEKIKSADELVILGPAETRIHLEKELFERHGFQAAILANQPLDSVTDNQIIAKVRELFNKEHANP